MESGKAGEKLHIPGRKDGVQKLSASDMVKRYWMLDDALSPREMSADEYTRLRQLDRQALYAHELPADVIEELGTIPVSEQARQFDDEYEPE